MNKKHCFGCYNEDYHYGLGGAKKCWSFKNAKLCPGRKQHRDTVPPYKGRWVLIPDCYIYQHGFVERKLKERDK